MVFLGQHGFVANCRPHPRLPAVLFPNDDVLNTHTHTLRTAGLIQDYHLDKQFKNALVVGKHLCGAGVDAAIEFCRKHADRTRGCVFATCCSCKIAEESAASLFSKLYFDAEEEEGVMLTGRLDDVAKATTWRAMTQCDAWQANGGVVQALTEELVAAAEFCDSFLQGFRRRKLLGLFGQETELLYCSGEVRFALGGREREREDDCGVSEGDVCWRSLDGVGFEGSLLIGVALAWRHCTVGAQQAEPMSGQRQCYQCW
jgi:hypothetical protein